VLNVSVPEVILDGTSVVSIARKLVAASMSEHMRMGFELEPCFLARAFNDPIETIRRKRCPALADKNE
jgi:hypothetical protein